MVRDVGELLESMDSKLSALILLSIINSPQSMSLKDKIKILSQNGITNQEISKILDISPFHVAKEKSLMKKKNDSNQNG
jgi:hypothetical protein